MFFLLFKKYRELSEIIMEINELREFDPVRRFESQPNPRKTKPYRRNAARWIF